MVDEELIDKNIFFKGNSSLITFYGWTFIIALTN